MGKYYYIYVHETHKYNRDNPHAVRERSEARDTNILCQYPTSKAHANMMPQKPCKIETTDDMQDVCRNLAKSAKPRERHKKIIALKAENPQLTSREIGKLVDTSKTTVNNVLAKYGFSDETIVEYDSAESKLITGVKQKVLMNLATSELKDVNWRDKVVGLGILIDKQRLIDGKSTANIQGIYHIISEIERAERKSVGSDSDIDSVSGRLDDDGASMHAANDHVSQTVDSQGSTDGV